MKKLLLLILVLSLLTGCSIAEAITGESNSEKAEYAIVMQENIDDFYNSMSDLLPLMAEASIDSSVRFTDSWYYKMERETKRMQTVIDDIKSIDPPPSLENAHDYTLKAMNQYEFVAQNTTSAIMLEDTDMLTEIENAASDGDKYMEKAKLLLEVELENLDNK